MKLNYRKIVQKTWKIYKLAILNTQAYNLRQYSICYATLERENQRKNARNLFKSQENEENKNKSQENEENENKSEENEENKNKSQENEENKIKSQENEKKEEKKN